MVSALLTDASVFTLSAVPDPDVFSDTMPASPTESYLGLGSTPRRPSLTSPPALSSLPDLDSLHDGDGSRTPLQRLSSYKLFSWLSPPVPNKDRKRPEMRRWTSHVDMHEVKRMLKRGNLDPEKSDSVCRRQMIRGLNKGLVRLESETQTHFPIGSTRHIEEVPLGAIYSTIVISWNAVVMLVTEVIIEVLIVVELYPKIPFRISFLFLTFLSGLLGAQTLVAVNRKEFDTSHNALQVALLVEISLIAGDIEFLAGKGKKYPAALPTRVPFMILTMVNVCLVVYLYIKLRLYENRTAHDLPECAKPVELGLGTFEEFRRSLFPPPPNRSDVWTLQDLGHAVVQHLAEEANGNGSPDEVISLEIAEEKDGEEDDDEEEPIRVQAWKD